MQIQELYLSGMTIDEVAAEIGEKPSVVRRTLRNLGIMRSRQLAISLSKRKPNSEQRSETYLDKVEKKEAALYIKANQLFKPTAKLY